MKQSKKFKQKGITLLEVLAVLVIISLVFVALSRNLGMGTETAKVKDVEQDFKHFQLAFEGNMSHNGGLPMDGAEPNVKNLNSFLDEDFEIISPVNSEAVQTSKMEDPWGENYQVQAKSISEDESILVVRSSGEDRETTVTDDLLIRSDEEVDEDDLIFVSYYNDGKVASCSEGFSKNQGETIVTTQSSGEETGGGTETGTGTETSTLWQRQLSDPVEHDLPTTTKNNLMSTYANIYAVDIYSYSGWANDYRPASSYRAYFFSNTPLALKVVEDIRDEDDYFDTPTMVGWQIVDENTNTFIHGYYYDTPINFYHYVWWDTYNIGDYNEYYWETWVGETPQTGVRGSHYPTVLGVSEVEKVSNVMVVKGQLFGQEPVGGGGGGTPETEVQTISGCEN